MKNLLLVGLLIGGIIPGLAQDFAAKSEVSSEFDVTLSMSGDEPLYLVSSMKTARVITKDQFDKINQDDVDYIQVIDDPASTHIYGDKAKFGVVLVVMKGNSFSEKYSAKKRKH